jgi:hypothetical protein
MILKNAFECQCRFKVKVHIFTLKVHCYVVGTYLLHLTPKHIFLLKLKTLFDIFSCHIDDFTICSCHLNKVHSVESP